jgi:calcineurin-like phosphoesterase family protein
MTHIFFSSDPHYNHDNIIKLAGRPFTDVVDMNETMIALTNERVGHDDDHFICGDFMYEPKRDGHVTLDELMARLNGRKHLIIGNHDLENEDVLTHPGWTSVQFYHELRYGKSRFVLCHYPLETWRNAHRGWYHLHGHCHGGLKRVIPHRLDVGVDCLPDFGPIHIDHVRATMQAQQNYIPQDHHGDQGNVVKQKVLWKT